MMNTDEMMYANYLDTPYIINVDADKDTEITTDPHNVYCSLNVELEKLLIVLDTILSGKSTIAEGKGPDVCMQDVCLIFRQILDNCEARGVPCISVVIEYHFVDRHYRDSFYSYYSAKHFLHSRDCIRLFIFEGDIAKKPHLYYDRYHNRACKDLDKIFLGYLVLTPIGGCNISKSILSPRAFINANQFNRVTIRTCPYTCTMYGRHLNISGFPYMKQDAETISCAEVTALLITDYYSQKYQDYRIALPSDVYRIANTYLPQRGIPSHGLQYNALSHVLKDIGFEPLLVEVQRELADDIHFILHCYLDSSIPVAIQISGEVANNHVEHSILCVGYGRQDYIQDAEKYGNNILLFPGCIDNPVYILYSSQFDFDYFAMDDNDPPYKKYTYSTHCTQSSSSKITSGTPFTRQVIPVLTEIQAIGEKQIEQDYRITNMIIPLNRRMTMSATDARDIFRHSLSGPFGLTRYFLSTQQSWVFEQGFFPDNIVPGSDEKHPLVIRVYMVPSRKFRHNRTAKLSQLGCAEAAKIYAELPMPRFVWVCELYSYELYQQGQQEVCGEIVIDATSSQLDREQSIILYHYPGFILCRYPNESYHTYFWKEKFQRIKRLNKWRPFPPFVFNHTFVVNKQKEK